MTNRRVNALEFVQIPKILNIIKWIDSELDEETREDFFRLKKVTDNKKSKKADQEGERTVKKDDEAAATEEVVIPVQNFGGAQDSEDEDIFV